jgi:flagellar biosynthetic protein FliR
MLSALATGWVIGFALVLSRIVGFVAVSPFPGESIPMTQRAGLAVVLAFVATQTSATIDPNTSLIGFAGAAASELAIGLVIGLVFKMLLLSADALGGIFGQATGLGAASVLNPMSGNHDTVLAPIFSSLAMLIALGFGAHRVALAYLLESFRALPTGHTISVTATMPVLLELSSQALDIATRLAMPVIALAIVVQVGLSLLSRAAPSLQIFSIGFAVTLAGGLWAMILTMPAIASGLAEHFGSMDAWLDRALVALGSG